MDLDKILINDITVKFVLDKIEAVTGENIVKHTKKEISSYLSNDNNKILFRELGMDNIIIGLIISLKLGVINSKFDFKIIVNNDFLNFEKNSESIVKRILFALKESISITRKEIKKIIRLIQSVIKNVLSSIKSPEDEVSTPVTGGVSRVPSSSAESSDSDEDEVSTPVTGEVPSSEEYLKNKVIDRLNDMIDYYMEPMLEILILKNPQYTKETKEIYKEKLFAKCLNPDNYKADKIKKYISEYYYNEESNFLDEIINMKKVLEDEISTDMILTCLSKIYISLYNIYEQDKEKMTEDEYKIYLLNIAENCILYESECNDSVIISELTEENIKECVNRIKTCAYQDDDELFILKKNLYFYYYVL